MPGRVIAGVLACVVLGAGVRFSGLARRGLWEVDEATYTLGARAYVHLFRARAAARGQGIDLRDRAPMNRVIREVFPMNYDFRYQFTRGPARVDKVMSGFRTWGKPTFCAAVVAATWVLGPEANTPALGVSALAGSLLVGVLGWAAWRLTQGEWAAVGAAGWAAVSLPLVHYSRAGYAAMLWTLCFTGVLVSGLQAWRDLTSETALHPALVRGALTGLLLSVFYGMLPMVALLMCVEGVWLWRRRRVRAPHTRLAVTWLVAFCAPLLLWELVGLWRRSYLHGALGFENVFGYFGEVADQMTSEVEVTPRSIASTVRFWAVNALAMEGVWACGLALAGVAALRRRLRERDPSTIAVFALAVGWLAVCTLGRVQLGRLYTPLLPLWGLVLGAGVQAIAKQSRVAAGTALVAVVAYGTWNLQPLLTARTGVPAAAAWIAAQGKAERVAITTFGYNQLFRAELNRAVANPPTRALLNETADLYVDVGTLGSRFTERTVGVTPLAVVQEPLVGLAPARLDMAGVADPWWRFRLDAAAWRALRGQHPDPSADGLIRIYAVDALP